MTLVNVCKLFNAWANENLLHIPGLLWGKHQQHMSQMSIHCVLFKIYSPRLSVSYFNHCFQTRAGRRPPSCKLRRQVSNYEIMLQKRLIWKQFMTWQKHTCAFFFVSIQLPNSLSNQIRSLLLSKKHCTV